MYDTDLVRANERLRHLIDDGEGLERCHAARAAKLGRERFSFEKLHHDEREPAVHTVVEDADRVRRVDGGGYLRLAQEPAG